VNVKDKVKQKYSEVALRVLEGASPCCGPNAPTGIAQAARMSHEIYSEGDTTGIPAEAIVASLGCGNPSALAQLKTDETVLDLGSGGGIDVFLSAKRVGPRGKVYGLDMTDEMLTLARENQRKAGVGNVEFLKGEIENIPLPDSSVDVVISNCVINLSADKSRVLKEAFRVLRPGGRIAVSDVVLCGEIPATIRDNPELWAGCLAGAMQEARYRSELAAVGFVDVDIEATRIFRAAEVREFLSAAGAEAVSVADQVDRKIMSASVRAAKPASNPAYATRGEIKMSIEIKVLGPGCANCKRLYAEAEKAVAQLTAAATLTKVEDIEQIMAYRILATPALVINGEVKSAGRIPNATEITTWLATAAMRQ